LLCKINPKTTIFFVFFLESSTEKKTIETVTKLVVKDRKIDKNLEVKPSKTTLIRHPKQ
jgi:hypothetical protein